jgi:hypothetical protein
MKNLRLLVVVTSTFFLLSSCTLFKPKYGCGTGGRNVGAEKMLDGTSGSKKAPKFKG